MATRKLKAKKVEEPIPEVQEVLPEEIPVVETTEVSPQPSALIEASQEDAVVDEPATYLPLKQVKLLRKVGTLQVGSVVDIIRTENDRLFFKVGNEEMYFDPAEVNRLYVVVQ